ncbi:unnamed protein product [Rhizophagus irregularis]|uniref:MARVEL domain-containing protein n=1 Tax=Rhizophagus irregularis TaxID=588596 RepID=A0A2N1NAT1_9GLOM|nr:hypothetical protein RhiirC2_849453 [Rhizophagus irregularis]CAB4389023.1 unnamed protein product [Rhizophagus irregularis]CAB5384671.1 unnamed protein product [Rhizophagus irregularis]
MVKPLHEQPNLFRRIRILQLSTVIIISFLEIIQVIAFIGKLKDSKPITYYLSSATFNLYGIKLLYHIVIFLTLMSTTYYFARFSHRWYHGPYQTDIYVDLVMFYLWVISGFTNVYPLLKGIKWECANEAFGSNIDFLMRVECDGYLFSTIFGWFMILEFFTSTILYLRLWKTRNWWDNNIAAVEDGESEKGINLGTDEETPSTESTKISPYEQHRLELDLGPRNSSNINLKQIF